MTRLAGLRTGEIDVGQVPLSLLSQVTGAQGINLQKVPGSYATVMVLGGQFPPTHKAYDPKTRFLDLRIRKALNLAANRGELFQTFYKGAAQPATLPFLIPGWDSLKPYPFDAAQAKTLLREANYPNGFEVTVQSFARGRAEVPSVVEGLCLQLDQVGVRCKINPTDYDTWRPNWPAFKGADMMWPFSWGFEPDYEGTLAITFGHKMAFPWAWDQKVADLLNTLVGVADPQKRKAIYNDVAKAMYEAYTVIPLGLVDDLWATNAKTIAKDWRPTNMQERVGWETIRKP